MLPHWNLSHSDVCGLCDEKPPGAGIMEADDCQVTTVFTIQKSIIGTRQTQYYEALPSSANDEVRCDCKFAEDGDAS